MQHIPLEQPIVEIECELELLNGSNPTKKTALEEKKNLLLHDIFSNLSPYQKAQVARHPLRPTSQEYIDRISTQFQELHGDRNFFDDLSVVGGLARIGKYSVMIIGHQKGKCTKERIMRNFGMPKPEGYRKALRLMSMAERMQIPIITLVDTPGAYPGVDAEERGQSEAIAKNIFVMSRLKTPILSFIIGEGGSGGALAIAVANRVHMLEHSIYSVISPEGCASILMKSARFADQAAASLKLTAQDLWEMKLIDSIIKEPLGGAHRDRNSIADEIQKIILRDLNELTAFSPDELKRQRVERYLQVGKDFFKE